MRKLAVSAAAVASIVCGSAMAAERTMSINFVGDWCYAEDMNPSPENKNTTAYQLPSWTEDGHCTKTKILSIDPYGFWHDGISCELVNVRNSKDTAPSGTSYTAVVMARCQPDGTEWNPKHPASIQTFEFSRYKGNLDVTKK